MADKLLQEFGQAVENLCLIPSSGGVFEVEVDGTRIFSKKQLKRHATWEEIRDAIEVL